MSNLVKFCMLAALVTVRQNFRTVLLGPFAPLELVVESTELVLEKVSLCLRLELRDLGWRKLLVLASRGKIPAGSVLEQR